MSHKKRNWSQYNKKLVNRGRITFWIDKDLAKNPFNKPSGKGHPSFSDAFLVAALSIRCVYSLSFLISSRIFNRFYGFTSYGLPCSSL